MRKISLLMISTLVLCLLLTAVTAAQVQFSDELYQNLAQNKNKIPHIEIPDYKKVVLKNGMTFYLMKNDRLPTIEMNGYIKGGLSQESKDNAGISQLMLSMMTTGTKNMNEQEFSRYQELHGISFHFGTNYDYFNIGANALSTDKNELISLTADILKNPDFKADYFSRIRRELYRGLAQSKTQQSSLLNMYFYKNIYGDHPYGNVYDYDLRMKVLKNIKPVDLERYYKEVVNPENIIIGIAGSFDIVKMSRLVTEKFGDWSQGKASLNYSELKADHNLGGRIILVDKPDATQAMIKMGYQFFNEDFKNKIPFMMANRVFGGGDFTSRLMNNLRSKKGYVYGIYASVSYHQLGGSYYIKTEVKPEKCLEAINGIKNEMLKIKKGKDPITKEELFKNVNLYNALLPDQYRTKYSVFKKVIYDQEIAGRNKGYINEYIEKYNSLKRDEVQQIFKKYTYPDRFFTVIVGKKDDILSQFKQQDIKVTVVNP